MAAYESIALTKDNVLGFGCMGITAFYGAPLSDADAVSLLQQVYDQGYRHFDTAEVYRTFQEPTIYNEVQVGNFLRTVPRASFTLATKFWPEGPGAHFASLNGGKFDLETVTKAVDGSLQRLGLDYIDLYYLHRMPETAEQLDEWMQSVKVLVGQGKIRHIGLSEVTPNLLRRAHAIHPIAAVQQEWAVVTRNLEDSVVPACAELGVVLVAYSPLARNLLAGEQKEPPADFRAAQPRFAQENWAANQALIAKLKAVGAEKGLSAAQLSLAWLYHQAAKLGVRVIPIPGTTKAKNAADNIGAVKAQLTDDEANTLAQLGASIKGERGNEGYVGSGIEGLLAAGR